jgi:hypothetical protein
MRRRAVLLLVVFLVAGCGNVDTTRSGFGSRSGATVRGQVLAGPGCPVETAPADGSASGGGDECADRPTAARIQVTSVNSGSVVATVRSDADGRFRVDLPAGQFELQALGLADPGVVGPPLLVRVRPGRVTDAVVHVDTGIR